VSIGDDLRVLKKFNKGLSSKTSYYSLEINLRGVVRIFRKIDSDF
jgi:hypothetical protein